MTTIPQVAQAMQVILGETAQQVGRASGFVQRQSKMGGAELVQTLVFGWLANPQATLEELAQTAATLGVAITPQGLDQRFTPAAAAGLKQILERGLGMIISAQPAAIPVLQRFNGVYLQDSTTIALPGALAEVWPGCGGRPGEGQAAVKLQVQFELCAGQLAHLVLQAGRAPDRQAPTQHAPLPAGALRLADLGYFSLPVLADLNRQAVYWLTRLQAGTVVFNAHGARLDLVSQLATSASLEIDWPVQLGVAYCLPARLLGGRVPPAVAATRRRRLRAAARKKGQTVSATRLALADWTVLVTNAPADKLSLAEAWVVARCRWQIELLFKLWKSQGQIDQSRSAKPWRILCEVYAKLLAMLIQHWLFLVTCWTYPDRSLRKAAQTIQKHALHLAAVLAHLPRLHQAIWMIQRCLAAGCRIHKRKAAPATFQLLLQLSQSAVQHDQLCLYQSDVALA